jgi:hypothetical protein
VNTSKRSNKKHHRDGKKKGSSTPATQVAAPSTTSSTPSREREKDFVCKGCGKKGHFTLDCSSNKQSCHLCKQSGHILRECPQYVPRTRRIAVVTADVIATCSHVRNSENVFISCKSLNGLFYNILPDTGAEFSAISARLVRDNKLEISPPQSGEVQYIGGADMAMQTPRIGTVSLRVSMHFPLARDRNRIVCTFDKKFEVMNLHEDFLLGTETFDTLFPNEALNTIIARKHDITDYPSNVEWSGDIDDKNNVWRKAVTRLLSTVDDDAASSSTDACILNDVTYDDLYGSDDVREVVPPQH